LPLNSSKRTIFSAPILVFLGENFPTIRTFSDSLKFREGENCPVCRPPATASLLTSVAKCVLDAGVIYLYDCPVQRFIPIYLVVGGVFVVGELGIGLVKSLCQRRVTDRERIEKSCDSGGSIVACFVTAWFIAGQCLNLFLCAYINQSVSITPTRNTNTKETLK